MLRNYFTIALRVIKNKPIYSLINVIGLSVGISAVLIIMSYVKLEKSYDNFHTQHEDIYRVTMESHDDGSLVKSAQTNGPLAERIADDAPGIDKVVRIYPHFQSMYIGSNDSDKRKIDRFLFADSTFFEVFDFKLVKGSPENALKRPFDVIITEQEAIRIYGSTNVLGRTLRFEDESDIHLFNVSAIMENIPQNSHFKFGIIASFSSMKRVVPYYNNWYHPPLYTYVKLHPEAVKSQVTQIIQQAFENAKDHNPTDKRIFELQALDDIHLYSNLQDEWEANSNATFVNMFILLAIFILLMACINFINLTTAQATERIKEVGVRKVQGSSKNQLLTQYLYETLIIVILSFVISLGLSEVALLTIFNDVSGKTLSINSLLKGINIVYAMFGLILISVLSGLYPALYLSNLTPISIFQQKVLGKRKGLGLRKLLVIFQFFFTSTLMMGTLIIIQQTNLMRNMELGFDKDHIIALKMPDRVAQKNYQNFVDQITKQSTVSSASLSATLPGKDGFHGLTVIPEGSDKSINIKSLGVDEGFIETYGVKLLEGRNFSKDIIADEDNAIIINESAAKLLGWNDALGKEIELTIYVDGPVTKNLKVIGISTDFHYQSLYNKVEPLVMYINKHPYYSDYVSVKFTNSNLISSVNTLQKTWDNFHPEKPMDYVFLDDSLNELYQSEFKRSTFFKIFTILSILISALGLVGLSAYSVRLRVKEIAIRKVLGSNVIGIFKLLTQEYIVLIFIANIIAIPTVWYGSSAWLDTFAYRTEFTFWIPVIIFINVLAIAFVSIGYHIFKVSRINPVLSLKQD